MSTEVQKQTTGRKHYCLNTIYNQTFIDKCNFKSQHLALVQRATTLFYTYLDSKRNRLCIKTETPI